MKNDVMDMFQLNGKVAWVAGGNGGIGSEVCKVVARAGARVAITGRNRERCRALTSEMSRDGFQVLALPGDMTRAPEVRKVAAQIERKWGAIDILINLVGGNARHDAQAYPEAEFRRILELNLTSAFMLSQAAGRRMIRKKYGKIVHFSSVRSLLGIHEGYTAYCASKGGLNLLTKQLATEWAKYGICVNAIAPTFINTELGRDMLKNPEFHRYITRRIPLGRVGEPQDLVGATLFLVSPASDFVTGQILFLDGGVTACQ